MFSASETWKTFKQVYRKEIWQPRQLKKFSLRACVYATLRVISISWTVFNETKAASRAAALSFSSLLGLGPLVAITVLIAGFTLDEKDPALAANTLGRLINFVAPQLGQYPQSAADKVPPPIEDQSGDTPPPTDSEQNRFPRPPEFRAVAPQKAPDLTEPLPVNPKVVELLNNFIVGARSGSAGAFGFFSLILIVLFLFKTVEDTFNEIWGVRSGRSLLRRIVYYWTVLTLGAVLFFASVTLLGASAFMNVFTEAIERLPFSSQMAVALQWSVPAFSFTLLVLLLTAFYRVIPNTRVYWRAAFTGAVVVASLMWLNNFLAFLYVRRVILEESLYGSLGILPVLMFGLYIFWLYVLIGGQISYAVQNVHFRNSQAAWSHLSETMRERLLLVVLLRICRRFRDCQPPVSAETLGALVKVPTQILNECLNRLVDLKLIAPIEAPANDDSADLLYQPAKPLNRITMSEFKRLDDNYGDDPVGNTLEHLDPILYHYNRATERNAEQDFFKKSLEDLFTEFPFIEPKKATNAIPGTVA
ncbi:MAG: YihY/virulence factor BrkB family protein [Opitutus sp.]